MIDQILYIESDLGYWGQVEEHDEIKLTIKSQLGNYGDDVNTIIPISTTSYVPQKGDKICFMPGVSIPRVKFKNLALAHGIKTVRNPEDANIFFANANSIHKMTDSIWGYKVSTEDFKKVMEDVDLTNKLDSYYIDNVATALEFYTGEYLLIDRALANYMTDAQDFTTMRDNSRVVIVSDDYKELIKASEGKLIFDEGGVVDQLNGDDASVIDEDMYAQLTTMFDSTDVDNHVLAMEIMANCKYNASLVYLLLLFKTQATEIYNCHTRNHVNFKSLINWISDNILSRYSIDNICKILFDKGQFTEDKLNIILDHSKDDILSRGNHQFFKIKTITVDTEYLAIMNGNYSYQVQDDFTPVVQVPEEVEEVVPIGEVLAPESDFAVEDNFEVEMSDEDIEAALNRMERKELKSELITLETENPVSESELNKTEEESNNNQINTQDESSIDWF